MVTTLTNTSGRVINALETYTGGTGPSALEAVGGNRTDPLPYPFEHIGSLGIGATSVMPTHTRDWRFERYLGARQEPSKAWQQLVQAGVVTLAFAVETNDVDQEDLFMGDLT